MRIEYEADADDFDALALAVDAGPPMQERDRRRAGFLPGWVPWVVLVVPIGVAIAYALVTQWRWQIDGPEFVRQTLDVAGQYEWLTPWLAFGVTSLAAAEGKQRGRRGLRIAASASLLLFLALASLAYAATTFGDATPRLRGVVLRFVPWMIVGGRVLALAVDAFINTRSADDAHPGRKRVIEFDDDFVTDEGDGVATRYRWAVLDAWHVSERLVLLYDADGGVAAWFPKRAVGSAADLAHLTDILRSRVGIEGRAFAVEVHAAE